eukprot:gene3180-3391_t
MLDRVVNLNFDDLGNEHAKSDYLRGNLHSTKQVGRSQYVPYFPARQNVPKTLNAILESKERVYLKYNPALKNKAPHESTEDPFNITNITEEEQYAQDTMHLDLGVEPLRRILFDMKKLGNEHKHQSFDPYAVRTSGLPRYVNYIHDKTLKMRDHQHTIQQRDRKKGIKEDKYIR